MYNTSKLKSSNFLIFRLVACAGHLQSHSHPPLSVIKMTSLFTILECKLHKWALRSFLVHGVKIFEHCLCGETLLWCVVGITLQCSSHVAYLFVFRDTTRAALHNSLNWRRNSCYTCRFERVLDKHFLSVHTTDDNLQYQDFCGNMSISAIIAMQRSQTMSALPIRFRQVLDCSPARVRH